MLRSPRAREPAASAGRRRIVAVFAQLTVWSASSSALAEPAAPAHVATSTRALHDDPAGARAAFLIVAQVLQHPRCRNCHPDGDRPLVGDPPEFHRMNVQRRLDEVGMACATCHQLGNTPGEHRPPGAPHWGLAPRAQVFEGRTPAELCRALRDPARNGQRSLEDVYHHITQDPLVLWGWTPGDGRAPVPIPQPVLAEALRAWIDGGAHCPEEAP